MPSSIVFTPPSRCWAEVSLDALRHNARVCQDLAGPHCGIMAIVKADAYGHGLAGAAVALAGEVDWFGVANVREALRVREAIGAAETPILILSPATPDEIPVIVHHGFSICVSSLSDVAVVDAAADADDTIAKVHAVIDTGMGRMGCRPEDFSAMLQAIAAARHCSLEGVETHFPSADEDRAFTEKQIDRFVVLIEKENLVRGIHLHIGNSAGLIGFQKKLPITTLVRPGLSIYGISPLEHGGESLRPVLSLKTRVTLVRDLKAGDGVSYGRTFIADRGMRVATLGVGYGDGYPRHLSGKGCEVIIGGQRCPVLGRITMDQIVVDVDRVNGEVIAGDVAILIGRDGEEEITAAELAEKAGTIPWEILTGITSRVERVYC